MDGDPFISEILKQILDIPHKMRLQVLLQQRERQVLLLMQVLELQAYLGKELLVLHKLVVLVNRDLPLEIGAEEQV